MILGWPDAVSPLHRFALAVTKWIGLEVANQGVSPTYPLRAGALALANDWKTASEHTSNVFAPCAHGLMLDNFLELPGKLSAIQQAATVRLFEICCKGKPPQGHDFVMGTETPSLKRLKP
jgi:hypothetical protein